MRITLDGLMVVKFAIGRFLFIRPPRHRHYLSRRRKESRQARRGSPRPPSSPSTRKRVQLLRGEGEGQGDSSRARAKRRKRKRKGDVRTNYSFDGLIEIRETAMGKWATIHAPRNIYIYISCSGTNEKKYEAEGRNDSFLLFGNRKRRKIPFQLERVNEKKRKGERTKRELSIVFADTTPILYKDTLDSPLIEIPIPV